MIYPLVIELAGEGIPVSRTCGVLGFSILAKVWTMFSMRFWPVVAKSTATRWWSSWPSRYAGAWSHHQ